MTEWFEEWFGEEYLHLYPHRDEAEAAAVVALLARTPAWRPGGRVLDCCCGAGRHSQAFEAAGARVVGLDLSAPLLARARQHTAAALVRADLRALPIRPGSMDLTVSLFTSFGYFADDAEHAAALGGMAGTVRPGGWFAIDFLHDAVVRGSLVADEVLRLAGATVRVTRQLLEEGRYVCKTIHLADGRRFQERVRLFSPDELATLCAAAGLVVRHRYGDYHGAPLGPESPRVILLAERPA
ncbi:MAG TPA: class I SAM-dependent methyltransferase [Gemmatimonadales bacterium]|nr:class I SAM-dependent methyltransferase [Gemmatimonadales bacterium]